MKSRMALAAVRSDYFVTRAVSNPFKRMTRFILGG